MNETLLKENKTKLLSEQERILTMLKRDDATASEFPGGFKPRFAELGSEEGENAFEVEQFQNDLSVTEDLDNRLAKIQAALNRMEDGSYGICSKGGEPIEDDRLRAEPAADTCVAHA